MKNRFPYIIILHIAAILVFPLSASAGTIYIWIDSQGVEHLTDKPPPEDGQLKSAIEYKPKNEKPSPNVEQQQETRVETVAVDAAVKKAEQLRQIADSAKREAAVAQAESAAADRRLGEVKTSIARNRQLLRRNKALLERLEAEAIRAKSKAIAANQRADLAERNAEEAKDQALNLINAEDNLQATQAAPPF